MASEKAQDDGSGNWQARASSSFGLATWSPKRQQLLKWFQENAESLAEAYEGALRMLADTRFPGRVHFIAHAIRDIADRLAFVLDPQLTPRRVQYEQELDRVNELWPNLQSVTDNAAAGPDTIVIKYELAMAIDSLVAAHRQRRQRTSNGALLFRYLMRNEPTRADVNQRLIADFKKMHRWFMRFAHLRDRKPSTVDEDELQSQFGKFEGMLHSFVGDFFTSTADLDAILHQAHQQAAG